ncbi:smoothelin, like [Cyprinodon tularosa]|uniref:smoothelin, like n=1 Tax=Cyprinodon tularosa TaxID=77115 RepID=UPI0018E27A27|nr:smoothelin, like [Cyprinodon tularosa]
MEGQTQAPMGESCHPRSPSPEGETVCAALARFENTLQDAIRNIQAEVSTFKLDIERRCEETANLSGPLGRAVLQLQQENQQLRNQLEALTRQLELLNGGTCEWNMISNNHNHKNELHDAQRNHQDVKEVIHGKGQVSTQSQAPHHMQNFPVENLAPSYNRLSSQSNRATRSSSPTICSSPPAASKGSSMVLSPGTSSSPSITRFSSRATFAVSSMTNSIEREEPIEVDPAPMHPGLEPGPAAATEERSVSLHGKIPPPTDGLVEHAAPVTLRMPHLPITATTKTVEIRPSPGSPVGSLSSPLSEDSPSNNSAPTSSQPADDSGLQQASVSKTWTSTPAGALGSADLQEKANSAPAKSVTYSGLPQPDRDDRALGQVGERRRELVRSQTLPRSIGAQTRRSLFERLDSEAGKSRPKQAGLKRSQSFGVSSASSIKQILLEWCRSKTVGYQNIDMQNFSSSWSDGMAFCALVHSFFPTEFDYDALSPANRRHNFELAFGTAEAKAGCDRLIEVEDMMIMGRKPDPMCVFTYVQSLYNHLRKFE